MTDAAPRRVAVLGATGSVGRQALDVIDRRDELTVCALAAARSDRELVEAAERRGVGLIALADEAAAARARAAFNGRVISGSDGLVELVAASGADVVLNAVMGSVGLEVTLATLRADADVALANKESLVAGGPLVRDALTRSRGRLLPVDSEHSALWQLLAGRAPETVEGIVLTASGGPFRGRRREELGAVGVDDALRHPTWSMGQKITIDSATLMNKGLEVIEAHFLFDLDYPQIDVVVHPQSIVHALVRLRDGAQLAHLGMPDMRVPIAYALSEPGRFELDAPRLDLAAVGSLQFERPDLEAFACLALARAAGVAGGSAPCVLNAANEEAVAAFIAGRCGFLDIAALVEQALTAVAPEPLSDVAAVRRIDQRARQVVRDAVGYGAGMASSSERL